MARIRRAILFTSADRYISLSINFALIAIMSRLLSPAEIGISVIGTMIMGVIEILRDVTSPYIIQEKNLNRDDVATAFMCMLALSLAFGVILFICSGLIGAMYRDPRLASYCRVLAISLLPGPVERPLTALMRRNMAFDNLAVINVSGAVINAAVTVGMAVAGSGFISFAWGTLAGNIGIAVLALYFQPDFSIFRPALSRWRRVLSVGAYSSAWGLTGQIPELASYLLLGRFLQIDAVGLFNRARIVNDLPAKVLLSTLAPVAFPALAAEARAGHSMGRPYLLALTIITAIHWPAFLMLALLAAPIVKILLGPQWLSIVPLVQIIAIANLLSFTKPLTQPSLMAMSAFKELLLSGIIILPIGLVIVSTGAMFGLKALAWSVVVKVPIDAYIELTFIRRHAFFTWTEFLDSIRKSVAVAICAATGPAVFVGAVETRSAVLSMTVSLVLAATGWVGGLQLTGHPLRYELGMAVTAFQRIRRDRSGLEFLRRITTNRIG